MKPTDCTARCAMSAAVLILATSPSFAAETLGDKLRESGCDRLIGTWIDPDTNGARIKTTFAWKFKKTLIEVTSKDNERESVALMGLNGKTREIYHLSADNQGTVSLGKWLLENKVAVLELGFTTAQGEEGGLRVRHRLDDNNTLEVTIDLPEPITFKLVRLKKKSK